MVRLVGPLLFVTLLPVVASVSQIRIVAVEGGNVTLPCLTDKKTLTLVQWSKLDFKQNKLYVFWFRHGQINKSHQLPSYKNRVALKDKELKKGDASLILENVTSSDRGKFECFVIDEEGNKSIPLQIVSLSVGSSPGVSEAAGLLDHIGEKNKTRHGGSENYSNRRYGLIGAGILFLLLLLLSCIKKH